MMRKVLSGLLISALLLPFYGCGNGGAMSLSEYRESISDLHDGVASGLGYSFEKLSSLDYDDYFSLLELEEVFSEAHEVFGTALREAEGMRPPQIAQSLHSNLVEFYDNGESETLNMKHEVSFFQGVLSILVDVQNLALPQAAPDAELSEIEAASAEDSTSLQAYVGDLTGMKPPEELKDYRSRLRDFLASLDESANGAVQGLKPDDRSSLEKFRQEYVSWGLGTVNMFWDEAMAHLREMEEQIDRMIEEGGDLAKQIHEL
jgi:hypothetical protein